MNSTSIKNVYKKIKTLSTDEITNTLKLEKTIMKSQKSFYAHVKDNPKEFKRIIKKLITINQTLHGSGWFDTLAENLGFDTHEQQGIMSIGRDATGKRVYNQEMKDELIRVAKNERASAKIKNDTIPTIAGLAVKKIAETLIAPELGPETAQIVATGLGKTTTQLLHGMGHVCPNCGHDLHGEGLGLSSAVMPESVKTLLAQHGNSPIKEIIAWREPIHSRKIIDVISLGNFEKNIKKLDYREVFHVGVSFILEDGYKGTLEKIDTVVSTPYKDNLASSDYIKTAPRLANTTLSDAFKNLETRLGTDLWRYDARSANCQHFVINFLAPGITNSLTPAINKFILQNAQSLTKGVPNKFMTFLTDIERKINQGIMG